MERRSVLKALSAAAAVGAVTNLGRGRTVSAESAAGIVGTMGGGGPLAQAKAAARRGMPPLKITDVKIVATAPSGSNWTIVRQARKGLAARGGFGRRDPRYSDSI